MRAGLSTQNMNICAHEEDTRGFLGHSYSLIAVCTIAIISSGASFDGCSIRASISTCTDDNCTSTTDGADSSSIDDAGSNDQDNVYVTPSYFSSFLDKYGEDRINESLQRQKEYDNAIKEGGVVNLPGGRRMIVRHYPSYIEMTTHSPGGPARYTTRCNLENSACDTEFYDRNGAVSSKQYHIGTDTERFEHDSDGDGNPDRVIERSTEQTKGSTYRRTTVKNRPPSGALSEWDVETDSLVPLIPLEQATGDSTSSCMPDGKSLAKALPDRIEDHRAIGNIFVLHGDTFGSCGSIDDAHKIGTLISDSIFVATTNIEMIAPRTASSLSALHNGNGVGPLVIACRNCEREAPNVIATSFSESSLRPDDESAEQRMTPSAIVLNAPIFVRLINDDPDEVTNTMTHELLHILGRAGTPIHSRVISLSPPTTAAVGINPFDDVYSCARWASANLPPNDLNLVSIEFSKAGLLIDGKKHHRLLNAACADCALADLGYWSVTSAPPPSLHDKLFRCGYDGGIDVVGCPECYTPCHAFNDTSERRTASVCRGDIFEYCSMQISGEWPDERIKKLKRAIEPRGGAKALFAYPSSANQSCLPKMATPDQTQTVLRCPASCAPYDGTICIELNPTTGGWWYFYSEDTIKYDQTAHYYDSPGDIHVCSTYAPAWNHLTKL